MRIDWIDNEKGVFLFLIIIGHFVCFPPSLDFLIYLTDLLYVPGFFFLSGVLFNKKKYSVKNYLIKKTQRLLIPYIAFSLLISLFDWNLYLHPSLYMTKSVVSVYMGNGVSKAAPLWFVASLYSASLLFYLLMSLGRKSKILLGVSYYVAYLILDHYRISLPMHFHTALGASLVMSAGYYGKSYLDKSIRDTKTFIIVVSCLLLFVLGIYNNWGVFNDHTKHSFLSIPSAIGGGIFSSYLFYSIPQSWSKKMSVFRWIANNGLQILAIHFYFIIVFSLFWTAININNNFILFLSQLLFVTFMVYTTLPFLRRFFPSIWGYK